MEQLINSVRSTQRVLQGVLARHALELFDSPALFATGLAVAVGLGLVHALTPGHGKAVIFSYFRRSRVPGPTMIRREFGIACLTCR